MKMTGPLWGIGFLLYGSASSVADAAKRVPVEISNVRFQVNEGFGDEVGHRYATVTFDAAFNIKPSSGHRLSVKALCKVGAKTLVATSDVQDTLADADVGLTKPRLYANPFISETLPAIPSSCDLSINFGKLFDKNPKAIGQYCWKAGLVAAGRCPP